MQDEGQRVVAVARALGHPVRVAILRRLLAGPTSVLEMVALLGGEQPTVSKHLGVLRRAGIVGCRPEGRCRWYSLSDPDGVRAVLGAMESLRTAPCSSRFRPKDRSAWQSTVESRAMVADASPSGIRSRAGGGRAPKPPGSGSGGQTGSSGATGA